MTITEALEILRAAQPLDQTLEVQLACSFTPLHLKTLLAAHLQKLVPRKRVQVAEGTFGDLVGTVERASPNAALAVAIEWQDLDGRLRYREGGAWGTTLNADLVESARFILSRIEQAILQVPSHVTIAVSLPTLPLLPAFYPPTWQAGTTEVLLNRELVEFAARISQRKNLSVINSNWLDEHSPRASRFDLKSDLLIGFPFTLPHAVQLASAFALNLAPRQPLKGIITDLDNTFWSGLVGEVGADAVRWDPATRYYLHGLFQKLLAALAEEGILIGIASKNDEAVVAEALRRQDLLISPDKIFPVEVHWSPKSESVTRILKKWNISADSVAFVDDTPLELAEVAEAHPGITALLFRTGDYAGVWNLLKQLRDLCGKNQPGEEDALRLESIRRGSEFLDQAAGASAPEEFLSKINAVVTFDFEASSGDSRILELVNKTNQFNLNGVRLTQSEWQEKLNRPAAFLAGIRYEDKFGSLGTIGVVQGYRIGQTLHMETWVMSCRAFSRRIEHQTLKKLFEVFDVSVITLDFAPTAKNGPLAEFLAALSGHAPREAFRISREEFERSCPALYHRVEEISGVTLNG